MQCGVFIASCDFLRLFAQNYKAPLDNCLRLHVEWLLIARLAIYNFSRATEGSREEKEISMGEFSSCSFFVFCASRSRAVGWRVEEHITNIQSAYWLLFRLSQRTPHCKTRGKVFVLFFLPAFRCGRRRENFFPSSSLVAGAGEFEKLLCCRLHSRPTWNNTTCVGHNLSYRLKRTRKLNGSLCVSNLLIHNLSHFPSVSLILAEPLSVVVQHHFHSYAHTHTRERVRTRKRKNFHSCISARNVFPSGWWGWKRNIFPNS